MPVQTKPIILGDRAKALGSYPHGRIVGDLIFLCGTSSRRADNSHDGVIFHDDGRVELDIEAQTKAVIENMRRYLLAAGADLEHLVDLTTFLVNMEHFAGYNRVYNTYFNAETGPTRTTVAVHQLPHPNLLIEIKGIARLP
jgi:2-aminomuconate deaminase